MIRIELKGLSRSSTVSPLSSADAVELHDTSRFEPPSLVGPQRQVPLTSFCLSEQPSAAARLYVSGICGRPRSEVWASSRPPRAFVYHGQPHIGVELG